ncbi:manganese efflux pump MntP [Faecalispora anaeroviscerum]|uniref:manganese efflux pump MntP n=1 Tax=Faecalispora anaeroviscerum TaxID=2991836 RepID=UPI0024BBAE93|nr:manganese efflux pump [Faecalispora anaeroviscerum]
MDYISLVGIAVGLSMDALAASIANGTAVRKVTPGFAFKVGLTFGIFQAFMPCLGWALGTAGANLLIHIEHWLALLLLTYLGVQMIWESCFGEHSTAARCHTVGKRTLLIQAVATSIDALATGIILPSSVGIDSVALMLFSVSLIGVITFVLCFAGVYLGRKFGSLLSGRAEIAGGIILILIGIKIFAEHLLTSA